MLNSVHDGEWTFIDSNESLETFLADFAAEGWIAVDTEFYRRDTYFPKLCLVQMFDGRKLCLVDTLSVGRAASLHALLTSPDVVKVFHAPEQDCEALSRSYGLVPAPIFDTQLAASMLGEALASGYGQLVEKYLGLRLGKAHARTDWRQRPLGQAQLEYAAEDVRFLGDLFLLLRDKLESGGKLDWFAQESRGRHCGVPEPSAEDLVSRLNLGPVKHINPVTLQHLAVWREALAQRLDIPRRWVVDDEVLARWSSRLPEKQKLLSMLKDVAGETAHDAVEDLLDRLAGVPEQLVELRRTVAPDSDAKLLFELLRNVVNLRAQAVEINPALLATRAQLEDLIGGAQESQLLSGWRYEVIGRELQEFLTGDRAIRYDAMNRKLESVVLKNRSDA